jgi:hypothetical protein
VLSSTAIVAVSRTDISEFSWWEKSDANCKVWRETWYPVGQDSGAVVSSMAPIRPHGGIVANWISETWTIGHWE